MIKLPLKTENILQGITLITVVFSLIGFFHAKYFYAEFGIDVANYFSLSDYLAVSVTKISLLFNSLLFMVGFGVAFYFFAVKKDIEAGIIDPTDPATSKFFNIHYLIGIIVVLINTFQYYLENNSGYYYGFFSLVWFLALEIWIFIVKKYSINLYINSMIAFLSIFIFFFSASIFAEVHQIKNLTLTPTSIYLDNNQSNSYIILGANSTYIFLYDRNQSKSFVYPTEKLEHIEIQNPSESNATRVAIMSFVKSGKDYIASFGNEKDMNVSK